MQGCVLKVDAAEMKKLGEKDGILTSDRMREVALGISEFAVKVNEQPPREIQKRKRRWKW